MNLPKLPPKAAYLTISNPTRRNALSLSVLRNLRDQLHSFTNSPVDGHPRLLPPFTPATLRALEEAEAASAATATTTTTTPKSSSSNNNHHRDGKGLHHHHHHQYGWLIDAHRWRTERAGLPHVLVLRSDPGSSPSGSSSSSSSVFSSGHDLRELLQNSRQETQETFALCAQVMALLRRFPGPVVSVVTGLATAAGAQLALSADLPLACAERAAFQLPGLSRLGLPCTSPATAASRRLGLGVGYRMFALGEPVLAATDLSGSGSGSGSGAVVEVVRGGPDAVEERVAQVVAKLAAEMPAQPQAVGKWAFWTQAGFGGGAGLEGVAEHAGGGDGYLEAAEWAGRVMALHARSEDAREGVGAFLEKREPVWRT